VTEVPVDNKVAMTGELSVRGLVKPIGGVVAKVNAARQAGAERVLIPKDNWQAIFKEIPGIEVIPVEKLEEVLKLALINAPDPLNLNFSEQRLSTVQNNTKNMHISCL
jgi:Lon-like ATP-dependent protease